MRVLQLMASTGFYGAERVVALLSESLAALGCDVTVGLFNASRMPEHGLHPAAAAAGHPLWDLPCKGRLDLRTLTRLVSFLREEQIELLHTHGYKANLYGLPAARLAGCPVLATCHNWTDRTPALRRYGSLDKRLLRRFDRVIAVSDTVAATLAQAGLPAAQLQVIANGIDTSKYCRSPRATAPPSGSSAAGLASASSEPILLGVLSRLSEEKGVDVLVRALPRIVAQHPTLECVIAGEGPQRAELERLAAQLGIARHLRLPGFVADIPAFLAGCTLVAHPSRIDGMPLAILEAMAAGMPIVASAVGGIPALLCHGEAGMLVPPDDPAALADGVLRLLREPLLRGKYAAEAALFAAGHFDAGLMARQYFQAYRELRGAVAIPASRRLA